MKLLEKEFMGTGEVRGFRFKQLQASEKAYLYEVSNGETTHYEIIKRKVNTRFNCETYPKSKSFGKDGFSAYSAYKARSIFQMMSDTTQQ